MRSVDRGEIPTTLEQNSRKWTKDLLDARQKNDEKEISTAERKYKNSEIQKALKKMYDDLCCYCESTVSANSFGHIEHRKPKSKFPEDAFNWNNLHWACERCNNAKRDKWDDVNPILDPSFDTEIIPTHIIIVYKLETIEFRHKTGSGKTTIKHADLNRPELAKARRKIRNTALALEHALKANGESSDDIISKEINEMKTGMYGSCIKEIL